MTLPVLYSLQNCPYAMRARLALLLAQQTVRLRAITMKDKPEEMLALSPKGTVPVLILEDTAPVLGPENTAEIPASSNTESNTNPQVIDESLDIMLWALHHNDPENLLYAEQPEALAEMLRIIEENDNHFKPSLEKYKRAKRFHGDDLEACRLACEPFIQKLELRLSQHTFLMSDAPSLLDYALLPFIRQFSKVNRPLFLQGPYSHLQIWLSHHLQSRLFAQAMLKYPLWLDARQECLFGEPSN